MFKTFSLDVADVRDLSCLNDIPGFVPIYNSRDDGEDGFYRDSDKIQDDLLNANLTLEDRVYLKFWFSQEAVTIGKDYEDGLEAIRAINRARDAMIRLNNVRISRDRRGKIVPHKYIEEIVRGILGKPNDTLDAVLTIS